MYKRQALAFAKPRPAVRTARVFILSGQIGGEALEQIERYLVNPVESRLASLEKPKTLDTRYDIPTTVETLDGFTAVSYTHLLRQNRGRLRPLLRLLHHPAGARPRTLQAARGAARRA